MGGFASRGFDAPCSQPRRAYSHIYAIICKFRFAMRALASGQASPRVGISALQAVAITILWTTQSSWRNLLAWSTAGTARAISPTYGFRTSRSSRVCFRPMRRRCRG
jgi:hypothetical protein